MCSFLILGHAFPDAVTVSVVSVNALSPSLTTFSHSVFSTTNNDCERKRLEGYLPATEYLVTILKSKGWMGSEHEISTPTRRLDTHGIPGQPGRKATVKESQESNRQANRALARSPAPIIVRKGLQDRSALPSAAIRVETLLSDEQKTTAVDPTPNSPPSLVYSPLARPADAPSRPRESSARGANGRSRSVVTRSEAAPRAGPSPPRPTVRGKALYVGEQKLIVRGVTYGPFGSDADGGFDPDTARSDFAQMAEAGINTIRLYGAPERWLLDLAQRHGLFAMVGIPWAQHIAFLDTGAADSIERTAREAIRRCAGHPAVLCYAIGNEIPASIVRWHGRTRIERFLACLCRAARDEDPGALVTYVNFPSTEYLRLPDCDFLAFNIYLQERARLERYLERLQNLADDRPLVLAELGLDSRRNGVDEQASSLEWQLRAAYEAGCAGAFVFAWTDQWHRGGHEILDWDFGITTRRREPKPAFDAVRGVFASATAHRSSTGVSVVVCTNNGSATLRECLEGVLALRHASYEVIVVCDGCTDDSAQVARGFARARVIETPRRGLAAARNTGMEAASGEVIAYIDDDAIPDPDWLSNLVAVFDSDRFAAAGGPNVLPPGPDGSLSASPTPRADRRTCCCPTARPSTFPAATWPYARRR